MTQLDTTQEQFDTPSMEDASLESHLPIEPDAAANGFEQFNLNPALLRAVEALGYTEPTGVQAQTIPTSLEGGDWMVSAQTGSGKTAAFLLPAIHALLATPPMSAGEAAARKKRASASPRVLVLAPTRELAQQVAQEAISLVRFCKGVRIANVVGGTAFGKQLMDLRGASLVVATPGRLLDLHRHGQIDLDAVQTLVVDEADRMLDLGFSEDLEAIHLATSRRDRTMMFSATFAPRIMALASNVMRSPGKIELATAQDTHANIEQRLHWFDDMAHKNVLLEHYLSDESMVQAVVFTATQVEADELADELRDAGYSASALHGAMPQALRNRRIKSLRDGTMKILVATDVAARGIDVPTISHVINYGLPMKPEDYVHRIGRTGRAGRDGLAITLAGARDRFRIRNIESYTQRRLEVAVVEGHEPQTNPQMGSKFGGGRRGNFGGGGGGGGRFGGSDRFDRNDRAPRERYENAPRERNENASRFAEPRAPREFQNSDHRSSDHFAAPKPAFETRETSPARQEFAPREAVSPYREFAPRGDFASRAPRNDFAPRTPRSDFAPRPPREGGFARDTRRDEFPRARPAPHGHRFHAEAAPRREWNNERSFERAPQRNDERRFERSTERAAEPIARTFAHQARAERRSDKPVGPAVTPPAPGGNRAARRAALQAEYAAKVARGEV